MSTSPTSISTTIASHTNTANGAPTDAWWQLTPLSSTSIQELREVEAEWTEAQRLPYVRRLSLTAAALMVMMIIIDPLSIPTELADSYRWWRLALIVTCLPGIFIYQLAPRVASATLRRCLVNSALIVPYAFALTIYPYCLYTVPDAQHFEVLNGNMLVIAFVSLLFHRLRREAIAIVVYGNLLVVAGLHFAPRLTVDLWQMEIVFMSTFIILSFFRYDFFRGLVNQKRWHSAVITQRDIAEKRSTQYKRLLRVVAHDLRSPLTVIKGSVSITQRALSANLPHDIESSLARITRSVDRQVAIIDHVRQIALLDEEQRALILTSVDLATCTRDAIDSVRDAAAFKQLAIINELGDCSGPMVLAERVSLTNLVIANILTNAIKFSPNGSTITIRAAAIDTGLDSRVRLTIADNGIGMPPDQASALFSGDMNHSSPGTAGESGTGAGASIVRSYVDRFNATIDIHSVQPGGTAPQGTAITLTFRVP